MRNPLLFAACIAIGACSSGNDSAGERNRAPIAASVSITTDEDTAVDFQLSVTDTDNDVTQYFIEEQPSHGSVSGQYPNLTYHPDSNYFGPDQFKYKVSDGVYDSSVATTTISVTSVNDAPAISGVPENSVSAHHEYSFSAIASDIEGDTLTFSINALPQWATFDEKIGVLRGIPDNSEVGIYENIIIDVSDGIETTTLPPFSIEVLLSPWEIKNPLYSGRHSPVADIIDNKIYVIGGYRSGAIPDLEIYDPNNDSWHTGSSMPTPRWAHTANAIDGEVYVIGGQGGTSLSAVEVYDPVTDNWTVKSPIPTSRSHHTSCVIDQKIYVFGGKIANQTDSTAAVEVYDASTDSWQARKPMTSKRVGMICSTIGNKIYLFGGANVGPLVEIYDPVLDSWSTGPSMLAGFQNGAAIETLDDKVYVFGGLESESVIQVLDPALGRWTERSPMLTGRTDMASAVFENRIFLFGGRNANSNELDTVDSYSPALDQ